MEITLSKAGELDLVKAETLFNLYLYEMTDKEFAPKEKYSLYDKLFYAYWKNDEHFPFLIYCDEELAGFSLVRRYPSDEELYDMGQFFILNKFRGKGIGRKAFQLTLDNFPGSWLVRVLLENDSAFIFWEKVISESTNGKYLISNELDEGLDMHFIRFTI